MYIVRIALSFLVVAVAACSHKPAEIELKQSLPYSAPMQNVLYEVPAISDIFTLTPQQSAEFLTYFNDPLYQEVEAHERVYQFLSRLVSGFDYQGQNYTASEAFAKKQGNCISLAVLTKALADLAGVDMSFQQMISAPVLSVEENWYVSSDHVRTFLYAAKSASSNNQTLALRSFIVVDYFPTSRNVVGERLTHNTFIAMFYRNLAADAIFEANFFQAMALLREALKYDPQYSAVINLAALVHKTLGYPELAEQWYEYGLAVSERKSTLLSNYAVLKQETGDLEAAAGLRSRLKQLQENDPFLLYMQGKTALQQRNSSTAVRSFEQLIQRAPYVAQFHLELAKSYYQQNRLADARDALAEAGRVSNSTADKRRFNAKLEALKLYESQ